ncbi:MAG: hypothetical protein HZA94_00030 [Candidatus Vogelbacteria bacterium]|nr:hypothetical protein [Candidatus Vogelbacteria bacterium]
MTTMQTIFTAIVSLPISSAIISGYHFDKPSPMIREKNGPSPPKTMTRETGTRLIGKKPTNRAKRRETGTGGKCSSCSGSYRNTLFT